MHRYINQLPVRTTKHAIITTILWIMALANLTALANSGLVNLLHEQTQWLLDTHPSLACSLVNQRNLKVALLVAVSLFLACQICLVVWPGVYQGLNHDVAAVYCQGWKLLSCKGYCNAIYREVLN